MSIYLKQKKKNIRNASAYYTPGFFLFLSEGNKITNENNWLVNYMNTNKKQY